MANSDTGLESVPVRFEKNRPRARGKLAEYWLGALRRELPLGLPIYERAACRNEMKSRPYTPGPRRARSRIRRAVAQASGVHDFPTVAGLMLQMFRRYKRSLGRWDIVSAALVVFSLERSALADVPLEPVALSYQAPEACPSFEQFLTEVQRWTPRLRLARKNEVARRFEARIAESGVEGQLVLEGGGGGERAVKGANCQAVAELLALAVALAADPDAK